MKQFLNKTVKYLGVDNERLGLFHGKSYKVNSTYGGNVSLVVGKTSTGTKIVSIPHKHLEILVDSNSVGIHSLLKYDGESVGFRLVENNQYFDIESDVLKGLTKHSLYGFKVENLIENNGLLVSEEELKTGLQVYNMSNSRRYRSLVEGLLGLY